MKSPAELLSTFTSHLESLDYMREPRNLYLPVKYVLSMGGKRIRPVLMMMAYDLYRDDLSRIMDCAAGIEIYHNFTLLHDDLMDHAEVRRGKQCVHLKWDNNTAILSGDVMLSLADRFMSHCDDAHYRAVMDTFNRTSIEIAEGQQFDMDFESRNDVTEEEYIEMIRLKTAVLLACSLKIGALMGDAAPDDAERLYRVGEQLGLAFQLHDDYLDVYGDPSVFGKKNGGDILCNKKTFIYIRALKMANDRQREELERWYATTDTEAFFAETKIAAVTRIFTELGMPDICRQEEDRHYAQAVAALDAVALPEEKKSVLRAYMAEMMNRKV